MRILTLSLIMTCVACAQAPQPVHTSQIAQPTPAASAQAQNEQAQDVAAEKSVATDDQIQASDVAAVMNSASPAPAVMDVGTMGPQVQAAFAKLGPQQSSAMTETSMALIQAANAGNQATVKKLSNKLAQQALFNRGFGLVDPAAIVAAIMDLIAAAANADVAGIIDAIMDLAAAIAA